MYDGWFRYQFGNEVREVNLLQLAAANGQIATTDPTSMKLQRMIDAATKTTGTRAAQSDPLYDNYVWQSPSELFEHQPTVRLDYNAQRQPPADRLVLHDHGQADARLLEQCRSAVSGRAQPARLRLRAAAAVHVAAVRDWQEHGQRAARRADRLCQRLEFRLRLEHHLAQRSEHVRRLRWLRDHHAGQRDRLVHRPTPRAGGKRRPTASKTR